MRFVNDFRGLAPKNNAIITATDDRAHIVLIADVNTGEQILVDDGIDLVADFEGSCHVGKIGSYALSAIIITSLDY